MAPYVGQLRTYPELHITNSMSNEEKALMTIVAIREYYNCGQPENPETNLGRIGKHLLWLQKLCDLACWEFMTRKYGYTVAEVDVWHRDAIGCDGVWFVRWVTDHILNFLTTRRVTDHVWAAYVVMHLSDVMEELQAKTVKVDKAIGLKGQKNVEATRFNDMLNLLEDLLRCTEDALRSDGDSHVGMDELLWVANEGDIICMQTDLNLQLTYASMKNEQSLERHICFKVISGHTINCLEKRNHSLPVENAVKIMLRVIPRLDAFTLSMIPLQEWRSTLRKYGFAIHADTLSVGITNEPWLRSGAATPESVVSHSLRTPVVVLPVYDRALPVYHRPPPSRGDETPTPRNIDDDNGGDVSPPGSQDWVDVKMGVQRSPAYPSVDPSPKDQRTPKRLFQPGSAQASGAKRGSRPSGRTYADSDRNIVRKSSLGSNYFLISDSAFQSTPRPMKRLDIDSTEDVEHADGGNGDADAAKDVGAGNIDEDDMLEEDDAAQEENADAMDHDAIGTDSVAALKDDEDTAMDVVVNNAQEEAEDFEEQPQDEKTHAEGDDAENADRAKVGDADGKIDCGDEHDANNQLGDATATKCQNIYAEYKSWPCDLKNHDKIETKLYNGARKDMLKCLSQAEEYGTTRWWDEFPADQRKFSYDGLEFDLKSVRAAIQSAKNQRPRKGSFRMLGEEIDQDEEGIRFDDVTKAVFSSGPKRKPEPD